MLTYALIGLGGAIGSVARAWLGTYMASVTGPSFPWGTILINIVGSFIIGFFGTLTATDGRFAAPFDVRAFVMVGICGGFTTFSSFSLQTLELARDGRGGQALGNVVLSVALCLASVAAGYSLAITLRTSRLAVVADARPGTMGSSTLLALHEAAFVPRMLAIAHQLGVRDGGRFTVLAIDRPVLAELQPTEEVLTQERSRQAAARHADWVQRMRPTLDRWVAAERQAGHRARWIEVGGDGTLAVTEHGRNAHLLMLEQTPHDATSHARVYAALVRAGRPVLLVPSGTADTFGQVIAVGWQNDKAVRAAVRTAAALLSGADRVVVIRIGDAAEDEGLAEAFHGVPIERVTAPVGDGEVGVQLLSMAHEAGADLLVIGSFSHGSLRETMFGGVTERVIRSADLPVLLQHQATG